MKSSEPIKFSRDEVTLREILQLLHSARWLILYFTLAATVIAGLAGWLIPKNYEAIVVISPVSDNSSGSGLGALGSLSSQFSGLASLAGLSLGESSKKNESLAVLQSEALTTSYIDNNNLLPILFRDKWDANGKHWTSAKAPTLWEANRLFKSKIRSVTSDSKTGLVSMTIKWEDPQTAARWANDLVRETNNYLRVKAIEESERNIAYLKDEASKTDLVTIRDAISSILQQQINKQMIARGMEDYALKVIDPAIAPERSTSPHLLVWLVGGVFCGLFLSVLYVILRAAVR